MATDTRAVGVRRGDDGEAGVSDLPTDLTPSILQGHVLDRLRELPSESVQRRLAEFEEAA